MPCPLIDRKKGEIECVCERESERERERGGRTGERGGDEVVRKKMNIIEI